MLAALAPFAASLEASCYCGAVRLCVDMARPPLSVSICHCASCRRLTGAPALANLMLPTEALQLLPRKDKAGDAAGDALPTDALVALQTSKHVTRNRCAQCHSPVFATLGTGRVVVPLSLFAPPLPEAWKPQHHLYYDRRGLDAGDELPKYRTHFGSVLWEGEPPEAAPSAKK